MKPSSQSPEALLAAWRAVIAGWLRYPPTDPQDADMICALRCVVSQPFIQGARPFEPRRHLLAALNARCVANSRAIVFNGWRYLHGRSPSAYFGFQEASRAAFGPAQTRAAAQPRPWRTAVAIHVHNSAGARRLDVNARQALIRSQTHPAGYMSAYVRFGRLGGAYSVISYLTCLDSAPLNDQLWLIRHRLAARADDFLTAAAQ
jgi:hypothetical protein